MGDLRDWSPEPDGAVTEDKPVVLSSASASSSSLLLSTLPCTNPNPAAIDAGCWEIAEQATREIISHVQPTVVSEKRRKEVVSYVQRLIRDSLGCEVFQFGSVPLKTYLPDGDIDLTAFGALNVEDALAGEVRAVLEGEEQNMAAKFVIKDVQLIRAEVKLVKCLVQNIVVDISFNQLGGLCTLCFLEEVDRLIGKSNLFKRSIILIKAWCYYESRILGAHHGLISTYALETLVLYIFHLFHSSLNGPLAVLYKFLDHFSKFDWDNYCISLNGPIRISSLPELVAEAPENCGGDLLLSNEFLRGSMEMFSVPSRVSETISRTFPQKHLNIVDPLRENNNLGRSVSKGNFYRIRSAFNYGARKLGHILSRSEGSLADEIRKFFSNTLDRHGKDLRPDVQDPVPLSGYNGFGLESASLEMETCQEDRRFSDLRSTHLRGMFGEYRVDLEESFCNGVNNVQILSKEMELSRSVKESQRSSMKIIPTAELLEVENDENRMAVSGLRLSGDAQDLATSRIHGLKISDDTSKSSRGIEGSMSPVGIAYHAPHLYCSRSYVGNGEVRNESSQQKRRHSDDNKESSGLIPVTYEETGITIYNHQDETALSRNGVLNSVPLDGSAVEFYPGYQERVSVGTAGSPEALDSLPNLSGEYGNNLNSLQYGRWCYEYALSAPTLPMTPPVISRFQSKEPWDTTQWPPQLTQDMLSHNGNGLVPQPAFYPSVNQSIITRPAFGREEKPKPRGTGTYIPNTIHYKDRPSTPRVRNQTQVRSPRNNGHALISPEINLFERSSHELSQAEFPVLQGGGKPRPSDPPQSNSPGRKVYPNANGAIFPAERGVQLACLVDPLSEATVLESSRQPFHEHSFAQNPSLSFPIPQMQRQKSGLGVNQDRDAHQQYQLKDNDDFPPLSV